MTEIDHGTFTAYKLHRCRCDRCRAANRRYVSRRARLIAYGQWEFMVDAEPVRQHVHVLGKRGLGWKRVAALAGVSNGAMSKLLYGDSSRGFPPTKRVRPATAAAILAVQADLDTLADGARTDAAGTRRRIQALACLGWSISEQARRLGWTVANYANLQNRNQVSAKTARAVRALYDELSMTPAGERPGAERARRDAVRKGYQPPLAWDDDLIDLTDEELAAELQRQAAAMDDEEVRQCNTAHRADDNTPLTVAGALEYRQRMRQRKAVA